MYTLFQTLWCVAISATLNIFTAYGTSWRPKRCSRCFFFAINVHGSTRYSKNGILYQNRRNIHPISDQNDKIYTLFQTWTGSKMIPFGAAHTYMAYVWEYPPSPPPPTPTPGSKCPPRFVESFISLKRRITETTKHATLFRQFLCQRCRCGVRESPRGNRRKTSCSSTTRHPTTAWPAWTRKPLEAFRSTLATQQEWPIALFYHILTDFVSQCRLLRDGVVLSPRTGGRETRFCCGDSGVGKVCGAPSKKNRSISCYVSRCSGASGRRIAPTRESRLWAFFQSKWGRLHREREDLGRNRGHCGRTARAVVCYRGTGSRGGELAQQVRITVQLTQARLDAAGADAGLFQGSFHRAPEARESKGPFGGIPQENSKSRRPASLPTSGTPLFPSVLKNCTKWCFVRFI